MAGSAELGAHSKTLHVGFSQNRGRTPTSLWFPMQKRVPPKNTFHAWSDPHGLRAAYRFPSPGTFAALSHGQHAVEIKSGKARQGANVWKHSPILAFGVSNGKNGRFLFGCPKGRSPKKTSTHKNTAICAFTCDGICVLNCFWNWSFLGGNQKDTSFLGSKPQP